MTYEEIVEIIKKNYEDVEDFEESDGQKYKPEGMIPFKEVYQEGGEGQGDHYEKVVHFEEDDIYISIVGRYSSDYGVDYDGWKSLHNVYPQEQKIIVYAGVKK
jgi:hypothetical protein